MTKDFLGAYVAFFIVIKRLLFTGIAKRVTENGMNSNTLHLKNHRNFIFALQIYPVVL